MGICAPMSGSSGPKVPEGMHDGILVAIYDMGTTHDNKYNYDKHGAVLRFELPMIQVEYMDNGETKVGPAIITLFRTMSMHKKANMRKIAQDWEGGEPMSDEMAKNYDWTHKLGFAALLMCEHKTKEDGSKRDNVLAVKPSQFIPAAPLATNLHYYSFDDHGLNIPPEVPEWFQDEIKKSHEYLALLQQAAPQQQFQQPSQQPPVQAPLQPPAIQPPVAQSAQQQTPPMQTTPQQQVAQQTATSQSPAQPPIQQQQAGQQPTQQPPQQQAVGRAEDDLPF